MDPRPLTRICVLSLAVSAVLTEQQETYPKALKRNDIYPQTPNTSLTDALMSRVFTALAAVILALFFVFCVALCAFVAAASMRANQGTYSPSRQEKEGSRVEMWNMVQPPPIERLI